MAQHDGHSQLPDSLQKWEPREFLERVLNIVPGVIYVFNLETMTNEYANRSIGAAVGYSEAEVQDMGSDMMPTICHPDDLPGVFEHFETIAALSDGQIASIEYRVRHKDGRWVWLLSHDAVFDRTEDGDVLRHIGQASDITRQKLAEDRAQSEARAAAEANEELCDLAYSVSHELKSPSNTLSMLLTELIEGHDKNLPEDATQLIALAQETVARMQGRVEDVLAYTRVLDVPAPFAPVSLDQVMSDVLVDLGAEVLGSGAQVDVAPLPHIQGNQGLLHTLFQNLVSNGLKFQPAGQPPHIQIRERTGAGDPFVRIDVTDNGVGIPQGAQAGVFDMFKRLYRPEEYPGNGLGLAICRRIATIHHGRISVASEIGAGSTFTVTLGR